MEYQVSRLSASLSGGEGLPSAQERLQQAQEIWQSWYATGALPTALNDSLETRFNQALAALYEDTA